MSTQTDALHGEIRALEVKIDDLSVQGSAARRSLDNLYDVRNSVQSERTGFFESLAWQRKKVAALDSVSNVAVAQRAHSRLRDALGSSLEGGVDGRFQDYLRNVDICIEEAELRVNAFEKQLHVARGDLERKRDELRVQEAKEQAERSRGRVSR